jgi:hypothetical protein
MSRCSEDGPGVVCSSYRPTLKRAPVCPDRLRIEAEDHPDLVGGRNWLETTRLAGEMAASEEGISRLRTSVHNLLSFKHSTQFVDVGCHPWKIEKKMAVFIFETTLRMPNEN